MRCWPNSSDSILTRSPCWANLVVPCSCRWGQDAEPSLAPLFFGRRSSAGCLALFPLWDRGTSPFAPLNSRRPL
jgi:hypothetical protein